MESQSGDGQHGQHDRNSQQPQMWAEFDPNTAPQVEICRDPEVVLAPDSVDVVEPDGAVQYQTGAGTVASEKTTEKPGLIGLLCRHKKVFAAAVAIILLIVVIVPVAAVVSKNGAANREGGAGNPSSSNTHSSSETSSASPTSDPGTPATTAPECKKDSYRSDSWVGLKGMTWQYSPGPAEGPDECCTRCYGQKACAAWLFDSRNGGWCTLLDKGYKAPGKDEKCTSGYPMVLFNGEGPGQSSGLGPCSEQRGGSLQAREEHHSSR